MFWAARTVGRLSKGDLADLASGAIAAVRIQNFLDDQTCSAVLSCLAQSMGRYKPARYPVEAYRFGPTLNEYREHGRLSPEYWDVAATSMRAWDGAGDLHVRQHIASRLSGTAARTVSSASIDRRSLYWPIVREISRGTLLHWDDVSQEYGPNFLDQPVRCQLALNVFLETPRHGGELRIWRRQWCPADETHRIEFGYDSALLPAPPDIAISAASGEAVLFATSNYHDVLPSAKGRRVTLSMFVGILDDGLAVWA
jgi:hypothetical protein